MSSEKKLGPPLTELPKALTLLLQRDGRQQKDVARELGISSSAVSRILSGKISPSLDTLAQMLQLLKVDLHDLASAMDTVAGRRRRPSGEGLFLVAISQVDGAAGESSSPKGLEEVLARAIRRWVAESESNTAGKPLETDQANSPTV